MANKGKPGKPRSNKKPPKFNSYWIWAGIILIFLGINFFGNGGFGEPKEISPSEFETYLKEGDVKKVEIVHHKTANVFLTDEAKDDSEHKNTEQRDFLPGGNTPDYTFELGDLQNFENKFERIVKENELDTIKTYKNPTNFWGDVLPLLIPFGIILLIWIFIMRRMSGAGGGGPGGQIFNIGKSKAK